MYRLCGQNSIFLKVARTVLACHHPSFLTSFFVPHNRPYPSLLPIFPSIFPPLFPSFLLLPIPMSLSLLYSFLFLLLVVLPPSLLPSSSLFPPLSISSSLLSAFPFLLSFVPSCLSCPPPSFSPPLLPLISCYLLLLPPYRCFCIAFIAFLLYNTVRFYFGLPGRREF